jgi:hypothetical protein
MGNLRYPFQVEEQTQQHSWQTSNQSRLTKRVSDVEYDASIAQVTTSGACKARNTTRPPLVLM